MLLGFALSTIFGFNYYIYEISTMSSFSENLFSELYQVNPTVGFT
jgi:hypothetical protein